MRWYEYLLHGGYFNSRERSDIHFRGVVWSAKYTNKMLVNKSLREKGWWR